MNNYKCPYDHDQPEFRLEWYEENFEKLLNERDEFYWKTQEDERIINDLRDAVDEKKSQRDEAIKVATILQGAYLRIGGAEDKYHTSLIMQECFKRLADLKEMRFFGMNDCCDDPRGMIGSTCDNCGGQVIPEKKLEVS